MTRIIMHGCNGAMGRVISELLAGNTDTKIVAGVDLQGEKLFDYPAFTSLESIDVEADVIIDFASAKAIDGLLDYVEAKKIPVVLCTTGLSNEQLERVEKVSQSVAVLCSANMSLGINLLLKLVKEAAEVLTKAGFDMEIVEKHHRRKLDAPSGTALALADAINEQMNGEYEYTFDRSQRHEPRREKEIGIFAVRAGSIVGDHDVIYAGEDEVVTISHTAYSRKIFAKGAIAAAEYLSGKKAGMYSMADVIDKK